MQKKNARPSKAESSAHNSAHSTGKHLRLSPRQDRVLRALLAALEKTNPWISRERIDAVARASNGPDVVARLRAKLGDDAILTERVEVLDYDGRPSNPGRYRLTPVGLRRLAELGGAQ